MTTVKSLERIRCPECGGQASIRSSRPLAPAATEFWGVCLDPGCACSFWGTREVHKLLSPSSHPAPLSQLPLVKRDSPDWPGDGHVVPQTPTVDMFDETKGGIPQ